MTSQNNPWASRFVSLLDREEIRRRATVTVPPLLDLNALPIETACSDLKLALRTLFVPTSQCLDNLLRWVGLAYAHCLALYPDSRSFLSGVYSKDAPLSELSYPICLTGLGGTGKSHLIKAFRRIMVKDFQQTVSADHSEFLFKALWSIQVNDRRSSNEMLMTLAEIDDVPRDLVAACRRRAYRNGVAFVLADGLIVGVFWCEPKDRSYELYLRPESCPLLKGAGVPISWGGPEGCRYQGPARQLLSNWKLGNLVVREEAFIAFRKVAP